MAKAPSKLPAKAAAKKTSTEAPPAKAKKPEFKEPKLPKSLGACVDLYYDTRQKRLAVGKQADEIKVTETFIANHIINNVPKGDSGAIGARYKGVVKNDIIFQIDSWEDFYAWIKKTGHFEVLNRAINQAALAEHIDALNEKLDAANAKLVDPKARKPRKMLPGVKTFTAVKLSVTKK
jgi:hypothetical protein